MRHIVHEIPYLDTRDLNLDWLIRKERELEARQAELEEKIESLDIPNLLIKVEDYGAVGDGIADDTNAIQKCIDENPDATIFFRDGIYRIVDTIHLWGAGGGQMIVLGGATIKYDGAFNYNRPMLSVDKDYSPLRTTSACRILGGNFDGNNKAGWCLEVFGFYTTVSYTKMWGFTSGGLCVGKIDSSASKSLQGKFSDIYIRNNAGFSLDDTEALRVTSPDNEFSGIVTDACKIAYHLCVGGNSFANCHSTQSFPGYTLAGVTRAQYDDTYHIYLDPANTGATQINTFNGCYFNIGKYVVYSKIPSRMCTTLDTCFYIFYSTTSLEFTDAYSVLCGGYPSDFRCSSIDVLIGGNYYILDYFPMSQPGIITLPDKIEINSNDRHAETPVYNAPNRQPEYELTPITSSSYPATLNEYYEIGAVMLSYFGASTSSDKTALFTVHAYNSKGAGEWTFGFTGSPGALTPTLITHNCTGVFSDLLLFISSVPDMITIEGMTYPTYYIYMKKTLYSSIYEFIYIENNSPFNKCYIRNVVSDQHILTDAGVIATLLQFDPNPDPSSVALWEAGTGTNAIKSLGADAATGNNAVAEGSRTKANGTASHAEGVNVTVTGMYGHGEGSNNTCSGNSAHIEGAYNNGSGRCTHIIGEYNDNLNGSVAGGVRGDYLELAGNGTTGARSNARTLKWTGDEWLAGSFEAAGGRLNDYTGGTIIGNGTASVSITGDGALMLFMRASDIIMYAVDYWTANAQVIFSNGSNLPTITKTASSRDISISNPSVQSFAWVIIGSYLR